MAVSHQWFVQWSAPPVLFADITSQYNDVNGRWKNDVPKWSDTLEVPEQIVHRHNDSTNRDNMIDDNSYGLKPEKNNGEFDNDIN